MLSLWEGMRNNFDVKMPRIRDIELVFSFLGAGKKTYVSLYLVFKIDFLLCSPGME